MSKTAEKLRIQPLWDKVVIEPSAPEEKTAGGIIIPDTAQEKSGRGRVVAVGQGYRSADGKITPLQTKVNDEVLFKRGGFGSMAEEVRISGTEYLIVEEKDILAVIS